MNVVNVNSDMTDPEHDSAAEVLYAELATLHELVIEPQQPIASRVEMPGVLKNVEADQVAA